MVNKKRIIYIKPADSSFIRGDEHIFRKEYEVIPFLMNQNKNKLIYGLRLTGLFFYLLSAIFKQNVIFISWFADYHSALMAFMGKLTKKKTVIFIGGQEAVCYPELNKGVYRKKIRGLCVKFALKNTDLIIANHKSLIYHENSYYNSENPHIDGIQHYIKGLTTPIEIIYNGIDSQRFIRNESIQKINNMVLTVGTMSQTGDFYNKGFDMFIEVASRHPEINFTLIGLNPNYLEWTETNYKVSQIPNLEIIPSFCPHELLNTRYNQAKVFVQVSITEGMPNTLSEAMLLECIPVGSNVNGIPDAIGGTGIIVKQRNVEQIEQAITDALKMNSGKQARERVTEMFSIEKRGKEILQLLQKI